MTSNSNTKCGFTLIELLVVMAIISVLVTLVVPSSGKWVSKASEKSEAKQVEALIQQGKFMAFAYGRELVLTVTDDRILNQQNKVLANLRYLRCEPVELRIFPNGTMQPQAVECLNRRVRN